tara:strand:+ start:171 stop:719 length:549 start_codon:yes stop_codon:yes gene_type:complete
MSNNFFDYLNDIFNYFDTAILLIIFYYIVQCSIKGFTASFVSFLKWIVALIITIIITPKLQPWVSEYIESPFINNLGLGIAIYISAIFILILASKAFSSSMKWSGFGPIDKTFGFFFGFFKGYVISVCIFTIINWFYPFKSWNIEVTNALTFEIIENGSKLLIEEFPNYQDLNEGKEIIEKI